jgi:cyclopropane-fatty-acyl-phospholipid synthase
VLQRVIDAAERGSFGDRTLEAAMWLLCRRRRATARRASRTGEQAAFLAAAHQGPTAVATDRANEQHYELPPEYFRLALGPQRKYSSALYPTGTESLSEAEEAMLALTVERAGITDGMRVLDLGCGWGSLSMWIARRFPRCTVVAMSNSNAQRLDIETRCATEGITNVEVITADINDFTPPGRFDRIVSVEMMEHVRNHRLLFERISRWLEPDGRLFVHIFVNRDSCYPFETRGRADWMSTYFFTGGMMPSWDLLPELRVLQLVDRWKVNGVHYGRTLRHWLARHDDHRIEVMEVMERTYGDDAAIWFQRWRMFFLACATLFEFDHGDEWFVAHYLFAPTPEGG